MKIAILGAGNVGSALARGWRRSGHDIRFGVRDLQKRELVALCEHIGATADVPASAADWADVVVLAVPWEATAAVAADIAAVVADKPVLDCTNPIGIDEGRLFLTEGHSTSGGEQVAGWLPNARTVKTLNQIGAELMAENEHLEARPLMFVAGDDAPAKEIATQLVRELGFEPHDAGALEASRLLEPLGMLWINQAVYQNLGRNWAFGVLRRSRGR